MLSVLLILVFSVHLLAVNVATAGPLLALGLEMVSVGRPHLPAARLSRYLAAVSIGGLALGIVLGLASLGILWLLYPQAYFRAFALIPTARLWFGGVELLFYFVCMVTYWALWERLAPQRLGRVCLRLLALLAATNLAYHFAPLFAMVSTLSLQEDLSGTEFRFLSLLAQPEVAARTAHALLASVAVSGVVMLLWGAARLKDPQQAAARLWAAVWGARIALVPTLLQLLVGTLVLVYLPAAQRERLLGSDLLTGGVFLVSLLLAFALMHKLAVIAQSEVTLGGLRLAAGLMIGTVVLMVAARHTAQAGTYDEIEHHATPSAATDPEKSLGPPLAHRYVHE